MRGRQPPSKFSSSPAAGGEQGVGRRWACGDTKGMAAVLQGGEAAGNRVSGGAGEGEMTPGRSGHGFTLQAESTGGVTEN